MPALLDIYGNDIRFLERVFRKPFKRLRRGIFGWGTETYIVKRLINVGWLQLAYDWERDAPMVILTAEGEARVFHEVESDVQTLS